MNRRIIFAALSLLPGGRLAVGADPKPPPSFAAFRSIGDGNIFDPNRTGRISDEPPPPAGDAISLVGTMQYEKGRLVFFDSPDADYRKTLREGEQIAQFTVARILADRVELTRDAKPVWLTMGQALRRPPGGEWAVGAAPRLDRAAPTPAGNAAPAVPADASDVLRRLMEQRQSQLRQ